MGIKILNIDGVSKSQNIKLPENLIGLKVNNRLLKYVVDWQLNRSKKPEFDEWRWASYWEPVECIIDFKKEVYQQVLTEFEPLLTLIKHKTDNG